MSNFRIMKYIEIDAAHRVPAHDSKCRTLHGHRYKFEAHCVGALQAEGAGDGMVLDFGFLKEEMVLHIDGRCDHGLILRWDDPLIETLCPEILEHAVTLKDGKPGEYLQDSTYWHRGLKLYLLPNTPTAENLARHFFLILEDRIGVRSGGKARLEKVICWETPTCYAEFPIYPQTAQHSS
jgi:6-pyruvoyltetrahydropterin/6-carboxytetrahydropterin synthase